MSAFKSLSTAMFKGFFRERLSLFFTFLMPLTSTPTAHFVGLGSTAPAACSGNAAAPTATAGNLCIYEGVATNIGSSTYVDPLSDGAGGQVRAYGAAVQVKATAAGTFTDGGSWAVTAP